MCVQNRVDDEWNTGTPPKARVRRTLFCMANAASYRSSIFRQLWQCVAGVRHQAVTREVCHKAQPFVSHSRQEKKQHASITNGLEVIVLSCPIVFDRVNRAWKAPSLNVLSSLVWGSFSSARLLRPCAFSLHPWMHRVILGKLRDVPCSSLPWMRGGYFDSRSPHCDLQSARLIWRRGESIGNLL